MISIHHVPVRPFRPLSQNILLHLSGTSLRKLLHYLYLTRYHEFADGALMFRPFNYFLTTKCLAMTHRHEGLGSFTPMGVCNRDYSSF